MKYLVVHPKGGFVDCMSVIDKCLQYAIIYNRIMVIDMKYSHFNVDLQKYVLFDHPNIHNCILDNFYESIKNSSVFPNQLRGLVGIYNSVYINNKSFYITDSKEEVSTLIDLTKDYEEDVLVYGHCRNGPIGKMIFNHLKFSSFIMDEYKKRITVLPKKYISFHIRNTDHKSNVPEFIEIHNDKMKNNVFFLASDNKENIDDIKKKFGSNVYTFSNITTQELPLHFIRHKSHDDKMQNIRDSICDLLILSGGTEFYYSNKYSGYSQLANYFHSTPDILKKLIE
jgi:hypothetical protein